MQLRVAGPIQYDSIVDGEGIRTVIWTQGCVHNCLGCHNPHTHSFTDGTLVDVEDIKKQISSLEGQDGITLSGGDPFCQVDACLEIAKHCKKLKLDVWCYTGYTFEQLLERSNNNPKILELLNNIDVLVDGKFELSLKNMLIKFRGSTNQRIINVKRSLKDKKVCLVQKYKKIS